MTPTFSLSKIRCGTHGCQYACGYNWRYPLDFLFQLTFYNYKKNQIMKLADGKAKCKRSAELHCRESLCSHHMHSLVFLEHCEIECNGLPLPHNFFVWNYYYYYFVWKIIKVVRNSIWEDKIELW